MKYRCISNDLKIGIDNAGNYSKVKKIPLIGDNSSATGTSMNWSPINILKNRAQKYQVQKRRFVSNQLSYVMLVPTLRCNLACSYCQVSRASETATGFDWSEETENAALSFLDKQADETIKVEFQGGEPLLRLDILQRVRDFCRKRFKRPEFIVCSNIQDVSEEAWSFLDDDDTSLSTSLDGTRLLHQRQRTLSDENTNQFLANLDIAMDRLGAGRVSALPTLDMTDPPMPVDLIETYSSFGLRSIFLRPINHMGFARKKHDALNVAEKWNNYHRLFVDELIQFNTKHEDMMEEFYFSHCLRRILQPGLNGHVDLRNPNPLGQDYLVIDYDGVCYPTDEARMLARTGHIDLSIGTVDEGLNDQKLRVLNDQSTSDLNPSCNECAYHPFCGIDLIDDISRYGKIMENRLETEFCKRHLSLFDYAFELLYSQNTDVQKSVAFWLGIPEFSSMLVPVKS